MASSKYQLDLEHAGNVSRLAATLFRGTKELHNLNDEALLLLEVGALLHDVGHFINTVDHDKHGYYILQANHLIGLSEKQQALVDPPPDLFAIPKGYQRRAVLTELR